MVGWFAAGGSTRNTELVHLTDLPHPTDMAVYEAARANIKDKFGSIPGVIEVLEFGMIPLPGISDMDFYVVVEPGKTVTFPGLKTYPDDQRYAMSHLQFHLSPTVFPNLRCFDPWIIHATPLVNRDPTYRLDNVPPLSEEDRHYLSFDFIFASWIFTYLGAIAEIEGEGDVPCREFMEVAKGTEYCFRELKRAGVMGDATDPNISIKQLRTDWFRIPDSERSSRVEKCVGEFKSAVSLMIRTLSAALKARATPLPTPSSLRPRNDYQQNLLKHYPQSLILDLGSEIFIFQAGVTAPIVRTETWKSLLTSRMYRQNTYVLPLELSATQNLFLKNTGDVSKQYQRSCYTDLSSLPLVEHPAIQKRVEMIDLNFADTAHSIGGKPPTLTYGAMTDVTRELHRKGNLRARLGGMYDRWMAQLPRTSLGKLVRVRQAIVQL